MDEIHVSWQGAEKPAPAEMDSWGTPSHGVPRVVYDRMERNEPSAWEKTRTAQVVPPAERAMDDDSPAEIESPRPAPPRTRRIGQGSRESEEWSGRD
ncbi:hypothetical protein HRG_012977 [Hirsutella rhossiliensis]